MATAAQALFAQMRRRGYSYSQSYAPADAAIWGRSGAFSEAAGLGMGRYPNPDAFRNPPNLDAGMVSNVTGVATTVTWSRATFWNQCFLARPYQTTGSSRDPAKGHAPGYTGNSRVVTWDHRIYVKSKSTGQWTRLIQQNGINGESVDTSFNALPDGRVSGLGSSIDGNIDAQRHSPTGGISVRPIYDPQIQSITGTSTPVICWHGYLPGQSIDPWDIADIAAMQRVALILHDEDGFDDRIYSRFLWGTGLDYIPDGGPRFYPNSGWGAHRFVTARYPNNQIVGYFTMSVDEFDAANGYPSEWDTITEGTDSGGGEGSDPGGGGGVVIPPDPQPPGQTLVLPSTGTWFAKLTGGANTWASHAIATGTPTKARRRRRARLYY